MCAQYCFHTVAGKASVNFSYYIFYYFFHIISFEIFAVFPDNYIANVEIFRKVEVFQRLFLKLIIEFV